MWLQANDFNRNWQSRNFKLVYNFCFYFYEKKQNSKFTFMKNLKIFIVFFLSVITLFSCSEATKESKGDAEKTNSETSMDDTQAKGDATVENPHAEGFDIQNSDPKAIEIADQVMKAMGGRNAYDNTRYLFWNFFGSRTLLWDKWEGNVRVESKKDEFTVVMNIHTMEGKVKMKGEELTHPDSLSKYLEKGKNMWINDSYWLVMPYKLKDSGVTLKYIGEFATPDNMSDVLELTFNNVGTTPQNKYRVYVDRKTHLVNKWDFYPTADAEEPRFSTPWDGYEKHGNIMLSGGRGDYQLTEIKVLDEVEEGVFEKL